MFGHDFAAVQPGARRSPLTSKKACISLFFFGGIGPFQWVTQEKIKKSCPAQLALKVVRKKPCVRFSCPFSSRLAGRTTAKVRFRE
jgi:hypothetical protein